MWTLLDLNHEDMGELNPTGQKTYKSPNQVRTMHGGDGEGLAQLPERDFEATMPRDEAPPDLLTRRINDYLVRTGEGVLFRLTVTDVKDVDKPTIMICGTLVKVTR